MKKNPVVRVLQQSGHPVKPCKKFICTLHGVTVTDKNVCFKKVSSATVHEITDPGSSINFAIPKETVFTPATNTLPKNGSYVLENVLVHINTKQGKVNITWIGKTAWKPVQSR